MITDEQLDTAFDAAWVTFVNTPATATRDDYAEARLAFRESLADSAAAAAAAPPTTDRDELVTELAGKLAGWWPEYIGSQEGWECGCNEGGDSHPDGLPLLGDAARHVAEHIVEQTAVKQLLALADVADRTVPDPNHPGYVIVYPKNHATLELDGRKATVTAMVVTPLDDDGAPAVTPPLLDPPEVFSQPAVLCPSCGHGIDTHSPTDTCMVGDVNRVLCECRWSPNDIAGKLAGALNDAELYERDCRDALSRQTAVMLAEAAKIAAVYEKASEIINLIMTTGPR